MKRLFPLALVILFLCPALYWGVMPVLLEEPVAARSQDKIDDKIAVHNNLVYGKGGGDDLKLDLAIPKGDGPFPAIVCVHGGGWRGGSKEMFGETIKVMAARGFVAATVQYRLTPKAQFPAQIEDCKCAVRWLRGNAAKYKIDKERLGAVGFSAGGHLVCLLGLTTREDGLEGSGDLEKGFATESSRVQAVVDFFGPTNLTKGDWEENVQPLLTDLLGGTLEEKKEAYKRASPVTYVRKDTGCAAFLIFHGTKDNIVKYNQSVELQGMLEKAGVKSRLVTMEGDGHGWRGDKLQKSIDDTLAFFAEHLGNRKP